MLLLKSYSCKYNSLSCFLYSFHFCGRSTGESLQEYKGHTCKVYPTIFLWYFLLIAIVQHPISVSMKKNCCCSTSLVCYEFCYCSVKCLSYVSNLMNPHVSLPRSNFSLFFYTISFGHFGVNFLDICAQKIQIILINSSNTYTFTPFSQKYHSHLT